MGQIDIILIDDNDIPIEITDLEKYSSELLNKYFSASNKYLTEYNKLKSNRSVESIMNL